jgi:integrase
VHPLTPGQARSFLEAIRDDRCEALYLVAIGVGLRQGEILGLSWPDIDFEHSSITVRHALQRVGGKLELREPKSATSHRTVAMPAFVHNALLDRRAHQREERLLAGSRWKADDLDLVFTTTIGTPSDGPVSPAAFKPSSRRQAFLGSGFMIFVTPARRSCSPRALRRGS